MSGNRPPSGDHGLAALESTLDGAALWGLEVDLRYRVLAATFEPVAGRHPHEPTDDRRLQVLFFPLGEVKASLRRHDRTGDVRIDTFTPDQLVDVVDSFGGATVTAPLFDRPERPGEWPQQLSLHGSTIAPDGSSHTLRLSLEGEGGRRFDFRATFDSVRVHDAAGNEVPFRY